MKLAKFLQSTGMTQSEFARRLGITQGRVSQWASGNGRPAPHRLAAIRRITKNKVTHRDFYPEIH